ncbi:MAG: cysteine synthase A [Alphaproteobacteria bacterium]|nr:cysteine synthase A [Alphaproteobacteria bacterium]MDP7222842.1 cysteine synthase A [Alphaproteobacteria bacterium]
MVCAPRGRIYNSITDIVGGTPVVRLSKLTEHLGLSVDLLAKLEFFNPLSSVKDRIALSMIETAEKDGKITPGKTVLIEPTSGNTGIGLAFIATAKGYRLILTMPESMSLERRKMLSYLGAELVLTPKEEGMKGAINKAEELGRSVDGGYQLGQFENPANPDIHRRTTAEEIWMDTDGQVDIFVGGVGTGGTITGVGEVLKTHNPDVRIVAVEPEESPVLSRGDAGPHPIQGIGAGFVPDNLNTDIYDDVMTVTGEESFEMSRLLAKVEGIPAGISSGAALKAAVRMAEKPENKGKQIVVLLPSGAERYLSTALFDGLEQDE